MANADETNLASLDGGVLTCEEALAAASRDYGGIERRCPRAVVRPRSAAAVAQAMADARIRGWPVVARGGGFSAGGQALVEDGLVVEMSALSAVDLRGDGTVDVGAGADWSSVLGATVPRGLTPPALPDFLGLSVGGTIAVGGVGPATFRHGLVADAVTELDIVTGRGELLTCSRTQNPELFSATIGSVGQLGIVTRARVGLIPAPRRTRLRRRLYADCGRFVDDLLRLAAEDGALDGLRGMAIPNEPRWLRTVLDGVEAIEWLTPGRPRWLLLLEETRWSDEAPPLSAESGHLPGLESTCEGRPIDDDGIDVDRDASHPWSYPIVCGEVAAAFLERTLATLAPRELGDGLILIYPLVARRVGPSSVGLPAGPTAILTALLPHVPRRRKERTDDLLARQRAIAEDAATVGGLQYPVGALRLEPAQWRAWFHPRWEEFRSLKRLHDPDGILAPGHGIG